MFYPKIGNIFPYNVCFYEFKPDFFLNFRYGCSIKDDQKITIHQSTTCKELNNLSMLELDADNRVDHISRSKEVYFSVSKLNLFSNWYMRNKSEDEILTFKYDRKSFMKVLYSFNPIVKLERTSMKHNTNENQSNYKSTFLKMIGLEKNSKSQESHSETEVQLFVTCLCCIYTTQLIFILFFKLSDMILSDDENPKSKWTGNKRSTNIFDKDKAHSSKSDQKPKTRNKSDQKPKTRSSESDHVSEARSSESDHESEARFSKFDHKPKAHSSKTVHKPEAHFSIFGERSKAHSSASVQGSVR